MLLVFIHRVLNCVYMRVAYLPRPDISAYKQNDFSIYTVLCCITKDTQYKKFGEYKFICATLSFFNKRDNSTKNMFAGHETLYKLKQVQATLNYLPDSTIIKDVHLFTLPASLIPILINMIYKLSWGHLIYLLGK